jgi:uncharacterized protein YjbI with pentapeptide repeats
MLKKEGNKVLGDAFENYIASLYEALNFKVSRKISVAGQEADIIAEKSIKGIGKEKLIIECKFKSKGAVSNQTVFDLIAIMKALPSEIGHSRGILITNTSFSINAKAAAHNSPVTLIAASELESQIFDLKEEYEAILRNYEMENISREYIYMRGSARELNREFENLEAGILELKPEEWAKISFITVLADYGSGKTTLLNKLNYEYAKKYLEGRGIKPFYMELKHYYECKDLNLFIQNSYKRNFGKELSISLFWKEVERGGFILLIDGFDEMSAQVTGKKRVENLIELSKLLLSGSNAILTCRPSFFVSDKEYLDAISHIRTTFNGTSANRELSRASPQGKMKKAELLYEQLHNKLIKGNTVLEYPKRNAANLTIELKDFDSRQVDLYLNRFESKFQEKCNASVEEIKKYLLSIYDLEDLMKKPILLNMISETFIYLGVAFKENNSIYDPSSLYETYTSLNFDKDMEKGRVRNFLDQVQRREFAQAIALTMFERKSLEVSYGDIINIIKKNSNLLRDLSRLKNFDIEEVATDLQICTFITRTHKDKFRFIHKSFMEFFTARFLKNSFLVERSKILINFQISKEILYFIGCFASSDDSLQSLMIKWCNTPNNPIKEKMFKRNIAIALILSKPYHIDFSLKNIEVFDVDFSNVVFSKAVMQKMKLSKVSLKNLIFKESVFEFMVIEDSSLENIKFNNSHGDLNLRISKGRDLIFSNSNISIFGNDTLLEEISFSSCTIECNTIKLDKVTITKCAFRHFSGQMTSINQAVIIDSKADLKNVNLVFNDMKGEKAEFTASGNHLGFESSILSKCEIILRGGCRIFRSTFIGGSLKFGNFKASHEVSLIESNFTDSLIVFDGETKTMLELRKCKFRDCTILGLLVTMDYFTRNREDLFRNCKGFIIIDDPVGKERDREIAMSNANSLEKEKSDSYFFVDELICVKKHRMNTLVEAKIKLILSKNHKLNYDSISKQIRKHLAES